MNDIMVLERHLNALRDRLNPVAIAAFAWSLLRTDSLCGPSPWVELLITPRYLVVSFIIFFLLLDLLSSTSICSGRRAVIVALAIAPFAFSVISVIDVISYVANRIAATLLSTKVVLLCSLSTFQGGCLRDSFSSRAGGSVFSISLRIFSAGSCRDGLIPLIDRTVSPT